MPMSSATHGRDPADRNDGTLRSAPTGPGSPFAIVITDPNLPDNPIIYVNRAFERVTQYTADYALGRNCRFLQGEKTDGKEIQRLRDGMARGDDVSVDIVNYRADGSSFTNRLLIAPLFNDDGDIVNYLGIQRVLPDEQPTGAAARRNDPVERELRSDLADGRGERSEAAADPLASVRRGVQDHLTFVMSLGRLADGDGDEDASDGAAVNERPSLGRRIESLQLLYEELDEAGVASVHDRQVPVGAYLSRVAATLNHLEGRRSIRMNVDCDAARLPSDVAARLGLLTSELILNALRHAFVGRRDGLVNVEFKVLSRDRARLLVKDDGIGMGDELDWPYAQDEAAEDAEERRTGQRAGAKLTRRLVEALGAAIDIRSNEFGTIAELSLDLGDRVGDDRARAHDELRRA